MQTETTNRRFAGTALTWLPSVQRVHTDRPGSSNTPIVFVIDGDAALRQSFQRLVRAEGWQAEAFASAADFLLRPPPTGPSCLVLDVAIPGLSGLELQRHLAPRSDLPIIFMTDCRDVTTSVQAMKAGAFDFLAKPASEEELLAAVRQALELSRAILHEESELHALRICYASLTRREREVLALVVSGLLNKQIAGELGISEITVKAHRGQVMRKMEADSLADLVIRAARLRVRQLTTD
jgi:FixJ family two-component response regulator